jgi:hypothetical protein
MARAILIIFYTYQQIFSLTNVFSPFLTKYVTVTAGEIITPEKNKYDII